VSEPCTLAFGGGQPIAGSLRDLSHGGAAVRSSGGSAVAGDQGTIALARHAGATARCEVRAIDHEGVMHLTFASMDPAFERVVQALLEPPRETKRA